MDLQAEIEKPHVVISDIALEQIQNVVKNQGQGKTLYLRLYVQATGGALSFGMALDTKKNSDDKSEVHPSGVEIVIDSISYPYLKGAQVSFTKEGEKAGFTITSPNADLLASAGAACGSCAGDAGCCG